MLAAALVTLTVAVQPSDTSLRPADFMLHASAGDRVEMLSAVDAVPFLRSPEPLSLAIVAQDGSVGEAVEILAGAHRQSHQIVRLAGTPHGLVADLGEARVALAGMPGKRAIAVVGDARGAGDPVDRTLSALREEHIRVYVIAVDPDPRLGYHLVQLGKLGDYVKTNRAGLTQAAERVVADIESEYTLHFPEPSVRFIGPVTLSVELGTRARAHIVEAPEFLGAPAAARRPRTAAPAPALGTLGYVLVAQMLLIVGAAVMVSARSRRRVRTG